MQKDEILDADRRSVPEHRLGVLKGRIGDYCRGEQRLLPQKIDAAAAIAAVDEIRRHYLPTSALQNDRGITAATAGVPKDCRQPVTFRRYERLRALMRRLIKIMPLADVRYACTAEQL